MQSVVNKIEAKYQKKQVVDVKPGDTVRVHQKVVEGGKSRVQIFEGLVIKASRTGSLSSSFTVRRIASGVGVEKSYLIHSPNIVKIEVTKRSKVRRNYLSYMRELTGKSARLSGVDFDKKAVNTIEEPEKEEKPSEESQGQPAESDEVKVAEVVKEETTKDKESEEQKQDSQNSETKTHEKVLDAEPKN